MGAYFVVGNEKGGGRKINRLYGHVGPTALARMGHKTSASGILDLRQRTFGRYSTIAKIIPRKPGWTPFPPRCTSSEIEAGSLQPVRKTSIDNRLSAAGGRA